MPTTVFIDRDAAIREIVLGGPISEETIEATLEGLLLADGPRSSGDDSGLNQQLGRSMLRLYLRGE